MGIGNTITAYGQSLVERGKSLAMGAAQNAVSQARGMAQNAARSAVNKGLSYVPGPLRGIAGGIANQALGGVFGSILGGCAGGAMYSQPEDFNQLRNINKKLVSSEFVQEWNFRLQIQGQPADFDLYIKDISYNGFEFSADEENYGAATYSWPSKELPTRMSFTARDNQDLRMAEFLHIWAGKVINNDGTVNLPFGDKGYLRKIRNYNVKSSGEEIPLYDMLGYPLQIGDCSRSHENGAFMEMPVTLVIFSTLYCR